MTTFSLGSSPCTSVAFIFVLLLRTGVDLRAQDGSVPESAASIKAAIAQHKKDIVSADSTKDHAAALRLRMALGSLSKPKEAQVLYAEAVQLADSLDRTEDELEARKALARTLAARGQTKQAYEEAMRTVDKSAEWLAQQAEISSAKADDMRRSASMERDSLLALADAGRRDAESRIRDAQMDVEFWMLIGIGAIAVGLVILLVMLLMNRSALRRQREEIQALRSDINALLDRAQNRWREPVVTVPVPERAPDQPAPIQTPVPTSAVDPMVLAVFRKQGPERLATLREARSRGDHEKVQRVVHTLKPQLVHFDPAFAQLCARLTDAGAVHDGSRWNSDLDTLEGSVSKLLD